MFARELKSAEIEDLLNRNPDIRARVIEFNALASVLIYQQPEISGGITLNIPGLIPPEGIRVQDSVYGTVIIFPDAKAVLHYTATSGANVGVAVTPSGVAGLLPKLPSLTSLAVIAGAVVAVVIVADRKL